MLRYVFIVIMLIHGLIHFMGFAKAFNYGNITQLTKDISKTAGVLWLVTACIFIAAVVLLLLKKDYWYIAGIIAAIISQVLIFTAWQDAKFGTIANALVLGAAITAFASIKSQLATL